MDELDMLDFGDAEWTQPVAGGDVLEMIETNLWLAEAYYAHGAKKLGGECLTAAWAYWRQTRESFDASVRRRLFVRFEIVLREGLRNACSH